MPSNHVWPYFESPTLPQFLNQAPPRAQQLSVQSTVVPHTGHVIGIAIVDARLDFVMNLDVGADIFAVEVVADIILIVVVGVVTPIRLNVMEVVCVVLISALEAVVVLQTVCDIDPDESKNICFWFAVECTQATPQSFLLNDWARKNMNRIS